MYCLCSVSFGLSSLDDKSGVERKVYDEDEYIIAASWSPCYFILQHGCYFECKREIERHPLKPQLYLNVSIHLK